ncbi:unnamed protein product [Fusarium graminearum]|uniref:Protein kinase domain-containing protein n=1 Tax=Gibberella zeae TaxID=5518 RepID=A0A4E9EH76_GIBZA|nr:unnamed protein product [Fusarium graminearum]
MPLSEGGARGVLFQVTLLAHGYTFVSKGTVRAFINDLEHEAAVYKRLKPIQGINVPVFLGAVDLRSMNKTYYYEHRVYVVHMTFLSWAGHSIGTDRGQKVDGLDSFFKDKAILSSRAMHRNHVAHKDVRSANMLFCPETHGVMMIDFERSVMRSPPQCPLAQVAPTKRSLNKQLSNKRASKSETRVAKTIIGASSKRRRPCESFSNDIRFAELAFSGSDSESFTDHDYEANSGNSLPQTPAMPRSTLSHRSDRVRRGADRRTTRDSMESSFSSSNPSPTPYTRHRDVNGGSQDLWRRHFLHSRLGALSAAMDCLTADMERIKDEIDGVVEDVLRGRGVE